MMTEEVLKRLNGDFLVRPRELRILEEGEEGRRRGIKEVLDEKDVDFDEPSAPESSAKTVDFRAKEFEKLRLTSVVAFGSEWCDEDDFYDGSGDVETRVDQYYAPEMTRSCRVVFLRENALLLGYVGLFSLRRNAFTNMPRGYDQEHPVPLCDDPSRVLLNADAGAFWNVNTFDVSALRRDAARDKKVSHNHIWAASTNFVFCGVHLISMRTMQRRQLAAYDGYSTISLLGATFSRDEKWLLVLDKDLCLSSYPLHPRMSFEADRFPYARVANLLLDNEEFAIRKFRFSPSGRFLYLFMDPFFHDAEYASIFVYQVLPPTSGPLKYWKTTVPLDDDRFISFCGENDEFLVVAGDDELSFGARLFDSATGKRVHLNSLPGMIPSTALETVNDFNVERLGLNWHAKGRFVFVPEFFRISNKHRAPQEIRSVIIDRSRWAEAISSR